MSVALIPSEQVNRKASQSLMDAQRMQITTQDDYLYGSGFLKGLKAILNEIDQTFNPVIDSAHKAHREALEAKKKHAEPVLEAEQMVKGKLVAWRDERERIRREEERRLAELARIAEQERLAREALAAEEAGDMAEAEAIMEEAVTVQAPVVTLPPAQPKVSGISTREVWKFRITDVSKIPACYMIPDETKIGGVVRAMKGATSIPGVQAYFETVMSAGR
jgi:hypothetical protein